MFSGDRSELSEEKVNLQSTPALTVATQLTPTGTPVKGKFSTGTPSAEEESATPQPGPTLERKTSGGKTSIGHQVLSDQKDILLHSPTKAFSRTASVLSPTGSSSRAVFAGLRQSGKLMHHVGELGKSDVKKEEKKPSTALIPRLGTPLPLLELAKKYVPLPSEGGPNFDFDLLTSQHLLENTLAGLDFGFERGLQPQKTICVGKIYSNHPETEAKLKAAGVSVIACPKWKTLYGFEQSFEAGCIQAVKQFLDSLKPGSRPVIMDDGGRLAKIIASCNLTDHPILKEAVFIEQTTSGGPALDGFDSPIINLYGALVKTAGEAPLVAASTVENLKTEIENLRKIDAEYKEFKKSSIAVIGVGSIGMAMVTELAYQKVPEIRVYDTDFDKMLKAVALGKPFERSAGDESEFVDEAGESKEIRTSIEKVDDEKTALLNSDIVIGATGNPIIQEGHQKNISFSRKVTAASVSSRQVDFHPWMTYAHKLNQDKASKEGRPYRPSVEHSKTCFIKNGFSGKLAILRHGTPITFNNGPHAMPPEHAQLTRCLIVGSQLQAIKIMEEKQAIEQMGKEFVNTDFKLSPLWQLFSAKNFLDTFTHDPKRYYSEETIANITNIEIIAKQSKGKLYLPFELKLRNWLDPWLKLKENAYLLPAIDNWLKPVSVEAPSPECRTGITLAI